MDRMRLFSPREVEHLISKGQNIVISDNRVLRLDGWLNKHPGGQLAVMHMVGRDATNEINMYTIPSFPGLATHFGLIADKGDYHSQRTLRTMDKYRIGRIKGHWVNFTPPIRGGTFRPLIEDDVSSNEDRSGSDTLSTLASSETSVEDALDFGVNGEGFDISKSDIYMERLPAWRSEVQTQRLQSRHLTPQEYTEHMVQKEIEDDLRDFPSLRVETQRTITQKYQQLHERVKEEGFYDCRYVEYGKEFVRYSAIFALFIIALRAQWFITSAALLGLFWHQIMFTAHDAAHMAITHNFVIDTLLGMFVADFCCGLSIGWWKSSHNVHHLITNHPEHDPDIQNVPLFATSPSFFKSLHSSYYKFTFVWDKAADFAARYQRYTYYPVMGIARFNLYLLSWLHLLSPRSANLGAASWTKPTEILFMSCYWYFFGYLLLWCSIPTWTLRVAFVLVSHIITMPLHVQITLSHFAMSTADLGEAESFPQRQLRTTMDVDCPRWLDFIHGGLQFQAVHHLFPRVPRHNLRRLQGLVKEFCADVGVPYKILGFVDGNRKVLGRLGEVAAQVEMLVKCQKFMAETGESGLH